MLNNLFGEFIDCVLGITMEEAMAGGANYFLIAGHTIGFWLFISAVVGFTALTAFSGKFRRKMFRW